eukprot:m.126131 g.126131  ORF g.126131 m.126131 type:complete len:351 (-) comp29182_c0_seq1:82-1134(-)
MESKLSPEKEAKRKSKLIEKQLKEDARELRSQIKLLLLGTGECGKSTLLKQMQLIHGEGFSESVRKDFVKIIKANVMTAMTVLYDGLSQFKLKLQPELQVAAQTFFEDVNPTVTTCPAALFSQMWKDEAIQQVYTQRHKLQLGDNCAHFMSHIDTICSNPSFIPSNKDVLYARKATVGVHEYDFVDQRSRNITFKMVDVGGQKSERRKWLACFGDVTAVIFIASLNDFDQVAVESEGGENRLKESLKLFKHIVKGKHMKNTTTIVFLNKFDLFQQKIKGGARLQDHFTEYTGVARDVAAAQKFIQTLFEKERSGISTLITTAIDTDLVGKVFVEVKNILFTSAMHSFNIE